MADFMNKSKGAISIFLVIILVPMMVVSALFVDASKVELARSVVDSAGDLTLNTALTNYDTKLKELYGLLATAQDSSDLYGRLEGYFKSCITSSGVSNDEAELMVDQIISSLTTVEDSGSTSDIMNMELVDFSVQKYSDADLSNATMLKKQIVEFMKYRAPINTGLSFLSALESFGTLSKQTELVEKKQAYYEAQQTVLENLKTAWSHIAAYNNNLVVTDPNYLTNMKSALNNMSTDYADFGKRTMVALYQNTDIINDAYYVGVAYANEYKYDVEEGKLEETEKQLSINFLGIRYYPYLHKDYKNTYNFKNKKFPTLEELKSAVTGLYNAQQRVETTDAPVFNHNYDKLQFMRQKRTEIDAFTETRVSYYSAYHKLQNVLLWLDGYDKVDSKIKDAEGNEITKASLLNENLKIGNSIRTINDWLVELNPTVKYEAYMDAFVYEVGKYNSYAVTAAETYNDNWIISGSTSIDTAISNKQSKVNGYVNTIQSAIDSLDKAVIELNSAKSKLTGAVATAKTAWSGVANDSTISSTSMAQQDKAELDQLDTYLNADNIDKLVKRLNNVKADLSEVLTQVKEYKYADKFLGDIGGYSTLESALGTKWKDLKRMPLNKTELGSTASSRATSAWTAGNIKTDWIKQSGHQPNLLQDKCSMYTYLSSHFSDTPAANASDTPVSSTKTEDPANGENFYKDIKSTSKTETEKNTNQTGSSQLAKDGEQKEINSTNFSNLPSKKSGAQGGSDTPSGKVETSVDAKNGETKGAAGKSASNLSSLFGDGFLKTVAKMGEAIRDKMYISDYVMSMFSYDTIEAEYNQSNDKEKGTEVPAGALLSLTKNDISPANNYLYGGEIEYIIYGGNTNSNLTKAYGSIYAIRFGFNLIYAFATSEIRDSALAIATPISAATMGVIPAPLIQAVIIIALACCESGIDLIDLRDGEDVPLYKSSKTWNCSISGLTNKAKNKLGEVVKEASDKLITSGLDQLNSLLDMTNEELTAALQGETNKLEEAVTFAYDQLITENANAAIQQLTILVNSAVESATCLDVGETYEQKKNQMKSWVKTELQNWGAQFTGDDVASLVKREAVNVIVNNSGTYIDKLFDTVETAILNTDYESTITDILSKESISGGLEQLGGDVMAAIKRIRMEITNAITKISDKINEYKTKAFDEIKAAAANGADALRNTINEQIDGICGASASGDGSTGMAALCAFSYSDYLRLFLLIGLVANEEKILLRTADVIQANMIHMGQSEFKMENAAVYVQMQATILVKPTLLALPLFADVQNNPADNTGWYSIDYSEIVGY